MIRQYRAIFSSIPDLDVVAPSPDQAIDKLRHKLRALSRYYRMTGRTLPESDNPVRPPRICGLFRDGFSVYVHLYNRTLNLVILLCVVTVVRVYVFQRLNQFVIRSSGKQIFHQLQHSSDVFRSVYNLHFRKVGLPHLVFHVNQCW